MSTRWLQLAAVAGVLSILAAAACVEPPAGPAVTVSEFAVEGMTCGHCEQAIQETVGKIEGVESVQASHTEKRAVVRYDAAKVEPGAIEAAIEKLGYSATLRPAS